MDGWLDGWGGGVCEIGGVMEGKSQDIGFVGGEWVFMIEGARLLRYQLRLWALGFVLCGG